VVSRGEFYGTGGGSGAPTLARLPQTGGPVLVLGLIGLGVAGCGATLLASGLTGRRRP